MIIFVQSFLHLQHVSSHPGQEQGLVGIRGVPVRQTQKVKGHQQVRAAGRPAPLEGHLRNDPQRISADRP